jgi:hypothetical protein
MNVGLDTLRSGMIIGSKQLRMNTIRTLLPVCVFTVLGLSTAAQLQNNQWRFGFNSAIDFNTNPISFPTGTALPTIDPPLITGNQIEGTASMDFFPFAMPFLKYRLSVVKESKNGVKDLLAPEAPTHSFPKLSTINTTTFVLLGKMCCGTLV